MPQIASLITTQEIDLDKIDSPALKKVLSDFNNPDMRQLMYDKHSDWNKQGQCGCVMGCVLG